MKQKTRTLLLLPFLAASAVHLYSMYQKWSSPSAEEIHLLQSGDGHNVLPPTSETERLQSFQDEDTPSPPKEET